MSDDTEGQPTSPASQHAGLRYAAGVAAVSGPAQVALEAAAPAGRRVRALTRTLGLAAIAFPLVYLVSDVVEVAQGDFSTFRLSLTYAGEAGLALAVVGLCVLLVDRLPWWALAGGVAYAYSFVFFASTVVWALVARTPDWKTLADDFGWWLTVHGAVMVFGGLALGVGIARSEGCLPRWTGVALGVGVVLVAAASGSDNTARTVAAGVPDVAFIAMGWTLLREGAVPVATLQPPEPRDHRPLRTDVR